MRKQLSGVIIFLLLLGGCTTLTEGPKLIWGHNVLKKAKSMNWICIGTSTLGELTNPITWFWTPPVTYVFVQQEKVKSINKSSTDWLVQEKRKDYTEGDETFYVRHDITRNKIAYVGNEATPESEFKQRMSNPKWEEPTTVWTRNTNQWLKQGKPMNDSYCISGPNTSPSYIRK